LGIEEYNILGSGLRKGDQQGLYCMKSEFWYRCWKLCIMVKGYLSYTAFLQLLNKIHYYYGSTVLLLNSGRFSVSWSFTQSVGLLGRGISQSQGFYLHTGQHNHTINA
jgi:hypothetical protein